jgi:glycosyltransferase involved in cell wall biosynthesis
VNIWILNHYTNTPDFPGGTRHFDLACELVKMGHNVTIFASSFNYKLRKKVHLPEATVWGIEEIDGVRFVWVDTFPHYKNDWRRLINMISYMLRVYFVGRKLPHTSPEISVPDVIIGSSVHLLAVVAAYFLSRFFKAHFVMEVRDLWPQTLVDMGVLTENGFITHGLRWLERFLYKRAERIIILLPKADVYITGLGIERSKIYWLPNGVNLSRLPATYQRELSSDSFLITYVGAHGRANALEIILEAALIIQSLGYLNIHFLFVGDGPAKAELISYKDKHSLTNTEFRDSIPKDKVFDVLLQSDALVLALKNLPLYKYGISLNKLFDYLAASKPVIFAGDPVNNIVKDAGCGLVTPPDDSKALADAIIQLYQMSPKERQVMGAKGYAYVEENHSYTKLASELESLLISL